MGSQIRESRRISRSYLTLGKQKNVLLIIEDLLFSNSCIGNWECNYLSKNGCKNGCQIQNGGHKHEIIVFFITNPISKLLKVSAPIFRYYQIINNFAE